MQTVTLYRSIRPDGGVTVSPDKPENVDYTIKYRLIADEGMMLTNGSTVTTCVDAESAAGWTEIKDDSATEVTQ